MDRSPNLVSFAAAGAAAFGIDFAMLALLTDAGLNPLYARLLGLAAASIVGWVINRTWTYGETGQPSLAEFGRYTAGGLFVTGVNFVTFAIILIVWPQVYPIEAMIVATIAAVAVSFAGYARYVFREDP